MKPTLHQLRIFATVAKHNGYTKAAAVLHLSQPAVSIQVKQLEQTVGMQLIEQLGKKIYLTEAGEAIYKCAQVISGQLEAAGETIDDLRGVKRGRLRLSVATTASYFVTGILARFADLYPQVSINLDVTNRQALLEQLDNNERDLVIMGEPPPNQDLNAQAIMDNPLVMISALDHELVGEDLVQTSALANLTFVIREQGSGTRAAIERFFSNAKLDLHSTMEMTSNEAIKQAVQAGLGMGVVSRSTVVLELETGRLAEINVKGFPLMRKWYLVKRTGKRLSPIASLFESFVLKNA